MHLVFDIFQGIGVAAALGIRPFLPAVAVGILAAAGIQIHFDHTHFAFLQSAVFLLVIGAAFAAGQLAAPRLPTERRDSRSLVLAFGLLAAVFAAVEFAGSLARDHYAWWPGIPAGILCAVIGTAASQPLLARVRARLDSGTAAALPLYAEGAALLLAVLSVLAPPVGPVALAFLIWLIVSGRRRAAQKYAGLRILR